MAEIEEEPRYFHNDHPCPFRSTVDRCKDCGLYEECKDAIENDKCEKEPIKEESQIEAENEIKQEDFDRLLKYVSDDPDEAGYQKDNLGGVQVFKKKVSSTTWMGLASVPLECTAENALNLFWNLDERQKWDLFFSEMRVVEHFDSQEETVYMAVKTPPLVWPRDFVQRRARKKISDDEYAAVFMPTDHVDVPERSGHVRGTVHFSGIHTKDAPETEKPSCVFTIASHTDFGAAIPEWLVSKFIKLAATIYFKAMMSAIEKQK